MSLQIIKTGLLDTIQDMGRYGFQHMGINPGGAMDRFAAQSANALLGKDPGAPIIEMHFPAGEYLFDQATIACISGADFMPVVNKKNIPVAQPFAVNKNSILRFQKKISGARCYLSILHDADIEKWLNSYSTSLVAAAGGFKGRSLQKGDVIHFKNNFECNYLNPEIDMALLPWKATENISLTREIHFIKGNEWDWLTEESSAIFSDNKYAITNHSNRMGYRLKGQDLRVKDEMQLISSGVTFGTIQLLPDGQLIVLMADHQTTGGYPRVGHVISADLPVLAQCSAGDEIRFTEVAPGVAELKWLEQQRTLQHMQTASRFKIEKLLNVTF